MEHHGTIVACPQIVENVEKGSCEFAQFAQLAKEKEESIANLKTCPMVRGKIPNECLRMSQVQCRLSQVQTTSKRFYKPLWQLRNRQQDTARKNLWTTFQMVKKCQTFFAVSSDESRPCACSQHVQNCLHGKDLTLSGSNKWFKTLVTEAYDCCAALAQAIDKTSSCFFHVGQISHQHLSHELSNLIIHSLKASQLGDDVIEDVFPDMFPAWTHRVATPNPQYPSKSEQNNPESLKTKTLKRTAACRVGQ